LALLGWLPGAAAVTPQPSEFLAAGSWFDAVFAPGAEHRPGAGLKILYEDAADAVTRGASWRGTPFQLGDKTYSHGLAFNSTKRILVRLGRPARRFTAEIGLENNDDTRRGEALGQGSVTFHVLIGGKEVFASPILRRRDGPKPIDLALDGASEFEIRVHDGGDGRGWDQALWAEAVVWMVDGARLRLQDLPLAADAPSNPFGFSFFRAGTNSADLIGRWRRESRDGTGEEHTATRSLSYTDPDGGLEARVEAVRFDDFPAVEWTVYLTNTGAADSRLLEKVMAFDGLLPVATAGQAALHWAKGAVASFEDFAPQTTELKPGSKLRLQPGGGRSSSQVMPFFNVEGAGGGVVAALGWTGEWAAEFTGDARGQPALKAGLDRTRLVLHPGEGIRTPRMLLLFYQGDRWQGQNLLRQFILAHHRPAKNGQPLVAPITCGNWGGTAAAVHLDNLRQIVQHQLPIDYYWIDAEWFGQGGWAANTGSWEVKKDLYPGGFKPLSQALRQSGRELMLWFEPERVHKGTLWHQQHPAWLLHAGGDDSLLNLGDPQARKFLTEFISSKIEEFGLGCYRQDFNIDPLPFWRAADAPDRQGMTEIRYIEGLYAFWDELRQRHPGLIIDNCASGGRRLDLETVGRATPFWRTDGPRDAIAHQCHTFGLLPWLPLSATSQDRARDDYEFRSSMCSSLCLNWWVAGDVPSERIPVDFPFDWARATLEQYRAIRDFYYGDYYPLTSYSPAADLWMGYELNGPVQGQALLVVLRRPSSPYETARFPVRGLDGKASYRITNLDTKEQQQGLGEELAQGGVEVSIKSRPGSALLLLERRR